MRILQSGRGSEPAVEPGAGTSDGSARWTWIDVDLSDDDAGGLMELADSLGLDAMAIRDAATDLDLPKFDDFGDNAVIVLHGLRDEVIATYEVSCFLTATHLVTVRDTPSPAIDELWRQLQLNGLLGDGGPDQLLARLADVLNRRLLTVAAVCEDRLDDLTMLALDADERLLSELTAVRTDLSRVRRVIHPQREVLDLLRTSQSMLVTDHGRRRFSDVFDLAARVAHEVESARTSLAETLDAYRGAEARRATDVSKVLTIYAAIMLPLSLVTGFFGMNFVNLPLQQQEWAWPVVTGAMGFIAAMSLGIFVALGWIRRPSGRQAGTTLGRGLLEATRTPAQVAGALFEISTLPVRATAEKIAEVVDRQE